MSKETIEITVVGCGDAFSSGGRSHSCFAVQDEHGLFTLDFGATSMLALQNQNINFEDIDMVVLTHLHGDHFGGLPYLMLAREFASKTKRSLHIVGPTGTRRRLNDLLECCYPGFGDRHWSYEFGVTELDIEDPQMVYDRQFTAFKVNHNAGASPCLALRIEIGDKVLGFSGDTSWVESLVDVARGADLFFCECNDFYPQDYEGHMDYDVLTENLHLLDAKQIVLNHAGPDLLKNFNKLSLPVAHDGMTIKI